MTGYESVYIAISIMSLVNSFGIFMLALLTYIKVSSKDKK